MNKIEKLFKVSKSDVYSIASVHIAIVLICIVFGIIFFVKFRETDIKIILSILAAPIIIISYYGIFPIYLCWLYYQRDKDVQVFVNYEKDEIVYYIKNKIEKIIKFDEIFRIEKCYRPPLSVWYSEIRLRSEEVIVVTSLLMPDPFLKLPIKYQKDTFAGNLILPKALPNITKKGHR